KRGVQVVPKRNCQTGISRKKLTASHNRIVMIPTVVATVTSEHAIRIHLMMCSERCRFFLPLRFRGGRWTRPDGVVVVLATQRLPTAKELLNGRAHPVPRDRMR